MQTRLQRDRRANISQRDGRRAAVRLCPRRRPQGARQAISRAPGAGQSLLFRPPGSDKTCRAQDRSGAAPHPSAPGGQARGSVRFTGLCLPVHILGSARETQGGNNRPPRATKPPASGKSRGSSPYLRIAPWPGHPKNSPARENPREHALRETSLRIWSPQSAERT